MFLKGIIPTQIDSINWQDYRGSKTGMVVYYNTDPVAELPIREIPEEIPTEILPEPNYETGTFGLYGCKHTKMRSSFTKKKIRYLFFMTRYAGTNVEYLDELMVTGFYRIKQIADVQKLHIRYLNEYSCINEDSCLALRADSVHFVAVQDALMITPEVLEAWGCTSRITRQTKIVLDEEKTIELLAYLESKKNIVATYSEETERLQPATDDEEEEEDEEDLFEDAGEYVDEFEEENVVNAESSESADETEDRETVEVAREVEDTGSAEVAGEVADTGSVGDTGETAVETEEIDTIAVTADTQETSITEDMKNPEDEETDKFSVEELMNKEAENKSTEEKESVESKESEESGESKLEENKGESDNQDNIDLSKYQE